MLFLLIAIFSSSTTLARTPFVWGTELETNSLTKSAFMEISGENIVAKGIIKPNHEALTQLPTDYEPLENRDGALTYNELWPAQLFDSTVQFKITRFERTLGGEISWYGQIANDPHSIVILNVHEDKTLTGFVGQGQSQYWIRALSPDASVVLELKPFEPGYCQVQKRFKKSPRRQSDLPPPPPTTSKSTIDILAVYTDSTATISADIRKTIKDSIKEANEEFYRSGAGVRLRLVQSSQISGNEGTSFPTALNYISSLDGRFDEIFELRKISGADIVIMYSSITTGLCGIASRVGALRPNIDDNFAIVATSCARTVTTGHEVAHLLGSDHGGPDLDGLFPYSHGYSVAGRVSNMWTSGGGAPLYKFSNPNNSELGAPFGTTAANDNTRSLTTMAPIHSQLNEAQEIGSASVLNDEIVNEKCVVATAAVGHSGHWLVEFYRQLRNHFLLTHSFGQMLVSQYYDYAPPVAKIISQSKILRSVAFFLLVLLPMLLVMGILWAFAMVLKNSTSWIKAFFILTLTIQQAHAVIPQVPVSSFDAAEEPYFNSSLILRSKSNAGGFYSTSSLTADANSQSFEEKSESISYGALGTIFQNAYVAEVRYQNMVTDKESPKNAKTSFEMSRYKGAMAYKTDGSIIYGIGFSQSKHSEKNRASSNDLMSGELDVRYGLQKNMNIFGQIAFNQLKRTGVVDNTWLHRVIGLELTDNYGQKGSGFKIAAAWKHSPRSIKKATTEKSAAVWPESDELVAQLDYYLTTSIFVQARYFMSTIKAPVDEAYDLSATGYMGGVGYHLISELLIKAGYYQLSKTNTVQNQAEVSYLGSMVWSF